jgi:hypothetical protein
VHRKNERLFLKPCSLSKPFLWFPIRSIMAFGAILKNIAYVGSEKGGFLLSVI